MSMRTVGRDRGHLPIETENATAIGIGTEIGSGNSIGRENDLRSENGRETATEIVTGCHGGVAVAVLVEVDLERGGKARGRQLRPLARTRVEIGHWLNGWDFDAFSLF